MIVLLILAAVLALLLLLPIGLHATYDAQGLTVWAMFGLIQFQIMPKPRRRGKPEDVRQKRKKKEERETGRFSRGESGG